MLWQLWCRIWHFCSFIKLLAPFYIESGVSSLQQLAQQRDAQVTDQLDQLQLFLVRL